MVQMKDIFTVQGNNFLCISQESFFRVSTSPSARMQDATFVLCVHVYTKIQIKDNF